MISLQENFHRSTQILVVGGPAGLAAAVSTARCGVKVMLVTGRCISCTREALAAIRVMPPCFAMGQAAGIAAAIALEEKCSPREIEAEKLQKALRKQGAVVTYEDI